MYENYLKSALRHLRRQPLYTFINLFGLAVGVAFVMLIFLYIRHELSYDSFFENAENLYRVNEVEYSAEGQAEETDLLGYFKGTEGIRKYPYLPLRLGGALKEEIPEVRRYTRVDGGDAIVQKDQIIHLEEIRYIDANFFEFFSFPLISGDPATVLDERNEVVLTPALAEKYFGRRDPVGEDLILNFGDSVQVFTVSGIAEAAPLNSSLDFQLLVRIENRPFYRLQYDNWNSYNTPLFVELVKGADPAAIKAKIDAFTERQFAERIEGTRTREGLEKGDRAFEFSMTPLADIHLDNSVAWPRQGSAGNMFMLGSIALLILLIACLNYISLSLAGASGRMKEVGVRKVLGSTPRMIARQFWLEAQVMVLLALILAIVLAELFLPTFNDFVQRDLSLGWTQYLAMGLPMLLIGFFTGILSGAFPATVISGFRPATMLKGNETYRYRPGFINGAVAVQFSLSVFLIITSLIMSEQMQFIHAKDLGFDEDQVLVLQTNTGWNDEGERLMKRMQEALRNNSGIRSVTGTSGSFSRGWDINGFETPDGALHRAFIYRVDYDYLKTLGIELVAGRNFSQERPADIAGGIMVNEALVADLGMEGDPIGAEVPWRKDHNRRIIGVVKDFHFLSLEEEIRPMLMHLNPEEGKIQTLLIKIAGQDIPAAMAQVERVWKEVAPALPFDYSFLDDDLAGQYEVFLRWTRIMRVSTGFAIFIACLGLFGLTGILTVNKTKEIGIRKVLGASAADILVLLNRGLLRLTLIALLAAAPAAWYAMRRWLDNFEYKIDPGWTVFAIAGLAVLVVALITVSYHSVRAAWSNPVDSLKYE